jgi:hypothetical protein
MKKFSFYDIFCLGLQAVNPRGKELLEVKQLASMERVRDGGNLVMFPALETFR